MATTVSTGADSRLIQDVSRQVARRVVGQDYMIDRLLISLLTGGHAIDGKGFWFRPGVLTNVPKHARAYHEEVFGPVAMIFRANGIDDAIAAAFDIISEGPRAPSALCALAAEIRPRFRGGGLATRMLDAMADLARDAGFRVVQHVSAAMLTERYFAGRIDGLRPPSNSEELLVAST